MSRAHRVLRPESVGCLIRMGRAGRELQRLASAKASGQHDRQHTDDEKRDASWRDKEDRGSEPSNVHPPLAMPRSRSPKPAATHSSVLRHVGQHKQGAKEATSPRVEWNLEAARLARFRPQHDKDEASGDRPPQARPLHPPSSLSTTAITPHARDVTCGHCDLDALSKSFYPNSSRASQLGRGTAARRGWRTSTRTRRALR